MRWFDELCAEAGEAARAEEAATADAELHLMRPRHKPQTPVRASLAMWQPTSSTAARWIEQPRVHLLPMIRRTIAWRRSGAANGWGRRPRSPTMIEYAETLVENRVAKPRISAAFSEAESICRNQSFWHGRCAAMRAAGA
jgi:hypothetical protein